MLTYLDKMRRYSVFIISLGLALGLNIYFRAFPIYFPQVKDVARYQIGQEISKQAWEKVAQDFPHVSALAKEKLVSLWIRDYRKQNKDKIKGEVYNRYLELKDRFQDENGQTYLLEADPWHWARYTENIYLYGRVGDKVVNAQQFDALMVAPQGRPVVGNRFLFHFSAFLYRIFSWFKPTPLFSFVFYLPLLFFSVFIITLYLFCYHHWGYLSAIITCMFVGTAPVFLYRSCAGWFDMDILNLLFPLLVIWFYLLAQEAKSFKSRVLWIGLSSFWLGLFSYTWGIWWFALAIILAYEIYSLTNLSSRHLQYKEENLPLVKRHFVSLLLFLVLSFVWIVLFAGSIYPLECLYRQIKTALTLNQTLVSSIWPNTFATVGELRKSEFWEICFFTGGNLLFLFAFVSMLVLFLYSLRNPKYANFEHEFLTMMLIWFMGILFASLKGVRFVMFLIIPLGISLGWAVDELYQFFRRRKRWGLIIFVALLIILGRIFIYNAYNTAINIYPVMNDYRYQLLNKIKETTPKDTIINSWWDYGDWIKAVAKRRVIFDGQSQDTPQAYWMARALLADNEKESIAILRMLNNGGNQTFELIDSQLDNPLQSVLLLEKVILLDPGTAEKTLLQFLPSARVEELMRLIFDKPAPAYLLVDPFMPHQVPNISFLGNWDFSKVYLAQNLIKEENIQTKKYLINLGVEKEKIETFSQELSFLSKNNLDNWISRRTKFYTKMLDGKEQNGIVFFDTIMVYNPSIKKIYLSIDDGNRCSFKVPRSLFLFSKDKLNEIVYPDNDIDESVLLYQAPDGYKANVVDRELAESLFTRLYFLGGSGLKHFKPFLEQKDGENHILVFEIIWD